MIVYTIVFELASPAIGWRIMFMTGALPGLFVLYLRAGSRTRPAAAAGDRRGRGAGSWRSCGGGLGRTTFFAALLATGVQGGYYTLATWLPRTSRPRGT